MLRRSLAAATLSLTVAAGAAAGDGPAASEEKPVEGHGVEIVALPEPDSPLVALRLVFRAGSIHDPAGQEGLAALTALMVGRAGTEWRSYADLIDAFYPMAARLDVAYDREVVTFSGTVHRDTLEAYTALLSEALLSPGFAGSDLARNKERLRAFLTTTLRSANDELLGLEAIQDAVFAGHPYGHPAEGTVAGIDALTVDDVRRFYAQRYTRAALQVGVAGGYPPGFPEKLAARLAALPAGTAAAASPALPAPPPIAGRPITLIAKNAAATGVHLAFPVPVTRADPDYYPLMVAVSYLGEHRTFHGRLMQQLRGERGLNYGDYAYPEHYWNPPRTSNPTPGVPRRQQYFSVWIRPVEPANARFALRAALHEVDRLRERGLTREEFELTRDFLRSYSKLWAQTLADRLGFHLDSRFYGMPYWIDEIDRRLAAVTVDEVNAAARKYLTTDTWRAVLVAGDAEALKAALLADGPSPIVYNAQVPPAVLEADKVIEKRKIAPTSVDVVPVAQLFEK